MKFKLLVILGLLAVGYISYSLTYSLMVKINSIPTVSDQTKRDCQYGAELTKPAFKGTQFENYDFYQSCIDNILYANPMNRR